MQPKVKTSPQIERYPRSAEDHVGPTYNPKYKNLTGLFNFALKQEYHHDLPKQALLAKGKLEQCICKRVVWKR
eukprot:4717713-Amphidinium_carterae.1